MSATRSTWANFVRLQLYSTYLMVKGLFVLALPAYRGEFIVRRSRVYPDRVALQWADPALDIYCNEEDGVTGDTRYFEATRGWSTEKRAYMWSALRNPVGNLRWANSFPGGPFKRWTVGNYYFQAGFRPDTGWPVLSAGTIPEGGFGYG